MRFRVMWNNEENARFIHRLHAQLYLDALLMRFPWIHDQLSIEEIK